MNIIKKYETAFFIIGFTIAILMIIIPLYNATNREDGIMDLKPFVQFNMLTPAESERLYLLSEELGESVQAICKILHHGYESTHPDGGLSNRLSLAMELGHVEAALELLFESGDLSLPSVENSKKAKLVNVKKYLHHQ